MGDAVPRRGNAVSKTIGRAVMRIWGFRFSGEVPNLPKAVVIVGPHTSNWDFLLGIAGVFALGIQVAFLGKHTLFRGVVGSVMRWLGGMPVDRRASSGVVEQTVELFESRDHLLVGLSPEGTRSQVDRWKTGFYHIASGAGVPIMPISFDYRNKVIAFREPLMASGDMEADFAQLKAFFANATGRRVQGSGVQPGG